MVGHKSNRTKYNFNLPKRAPAPYGYANDDTMESWEFENNTSNLLLFKSDYFDPTTYVDDEGNVLPNWRKDFEARFPSDAWLDTNILQEFVSFVYSTDRTQATGNALPSSVTYDGVTYTTDTAAYRLAKFKAEFPTYAELDTFIFYYIFTELFLMVDSRAKNLFVGFNGSNVTASGRKARRKATAQPYDMDTAAGTNNEGSLVFGYSLEDTDHMAGGADIFNGQQSVLWNNLRDSYNTEIVRMYQTLRSNGILSYNNVEQRYEEHQSKWSEAIWMEDAWFKYIDPLINPDEGKEATAVYLPMMQGSKEEQRKWWMINRFRYMDSKWNAGEALSQVIQLRGYAKANITVTPYADIYPTVKYGSYLVSERGEHDQPTTLVCPIDELNDTEIYIYSAPQLASVGDLAPLKVGFADFSMATRLQSIKIGDSSSSYSNTNLYSLSLGSNVLLKTLDVRNCSGLGDTTMEGHTQTTVDLSGCEIIEEIYFGGTKVTGVSVPNGGVLRVLSLPKTITSLIVRNQSAITTFEVEDDDYSNITTLRIENCSSAIPMMEILSDIPANSRVRLIGFTITASSTDDVEDFYDYLDTMRGLDENGNNVDTAQVQGVITGLGTITGTWLAEMNARYPYITIEYEHITSKLYYYNGSTLFYTENISDGGNGTYSGTPTKAQDAQYTYTFIGWSKDEDDNTVDANAQTNVTADRNIYACYTGTLRGYTITWVNADSTVLETDTNVLYGTMPTYDGATPTYQGETATGWSPNVVPVTGDATYTALYVPMYTATFARASEDGGGTLWSGRFAEGTTPVYGGETPTTTQGDSTEFTFTGWTPTLAPIYADTTYTAVFQDIRALTIQYLTRNITNYESENNTIFAGYGLAHASKLVSAKAPATTVQGYAFRNDTALEVVDLSATSGAVTIDAYAFEGCTALTHLIIRSSTMATLNNISALNGTAIVRGEGAIYVPTSLIATYKADALWSNYFIADINDYPLSSFETISDSWSTIIANNNYATDYKIGDTKLVDFGTFGQHYFELVAMDEDDKADGSGKARMTWMSKNFIDTHRMNGSATTVGGYNASEMKSWIASNVLPQLQSEIRNALVPVTKISGTYENGAIVVNGQSTTESLWIPSNHEIYGSTSEEDTGARYSVFSNNTTRIKYSNYGTAQSWWLRSAYSSNSFLQVSSSGSGSTYTASSSYGVVIGFCI